MRLLFTRILTACFLLPGIARAQQITYAPSPSGGALVNNTDFQIIGKCGGNIWVYLNRGHYDPVINLYDAGMRLVRRVSLDFLPPGASGVDFITYPEKVLVFYQYFHRGEVLYYAVSLNAKALPEGKPVLIDRSPLRFNRTSAETYNMISSDDKERIMAFIVRKKAGYGDYHIFSFLLDKNLRLLRKKENLLSVPDAGDELFNFQLTNNGNLVFEVIGRGGMDNNYIVTAGLVALYPGSDTLHMMPVPLQGHYLDTLFQVKLDNAHNRLSLASFYFDTRKRNINGIFLCGADSGAAPQVSFLPFGDSLKSEIKGTESSLKQAFDDYKLGDLVIQGKGGLVLVAENSYHDPSRGTSYEDIALLSYDDRDSLKWCRVIRKDQSDDLGYDFSSYQIVNTGNELHFLFNGKNRGSYTFSNYIYLITDYSLTRGGDLVQLPLMRNLERKYRLMPRYARQVGAREVVLPFEMGSELSFARIDY